MSIVKNILNFFKDILAPKKCYNCGKYGSFLCINCSEKLDYFNWFCYICKKKSENFSIHKKCLIENKLLYWKNFNDKKIYLDKVIVMAYYKNEVIKKMIRDFKFYWKKEVWEELWKYLWNFVKKNEIINSFSTEGFSPFEDSESSSEWQSNFMVLPVPLHFFKKIKRWFNQSEILAKNFSKILKINYNKKVLIRKKYTRQQSKLDRQKRLGNLNNSFKIRKNQLDKIDKKIIFLIDDVVTTWTTLNEIAKVLKQNWAKKVIGVCLASN